MKCACSCGLPAKPGSKYHHPPTCRPRAHKLRLALEGLTPVERKRRLDREAKKAARARGRIPSDDRVSMARAVAVLTDYLSSTWDSVSWDPAVSSRELAEAEAREILERARRR